MSTNRFNHREDDRSMVDDADYKSNEEQKADKKQRRNTYSRRNGGPTAFNGIHRRRKKRIMW